MMLPGIYGLAWLAISAFELRGTLYIATAAAFAGSGGLPGPRLAISGVRPGIVRTRHWGAGAVPTGYL